MATMHKGQQYPTSLSLIDGGKVTSHKVKYSHHPDGRTHFSQDGKIFTKVIKSSASFDEVDGHLFTVQFQDFANVMRQSRLRPINSAAQLLDQLKAEVALKPESRAKSLGF